MCRITCGSSIESYPSVWTPLPEFREGRILLQYQREIGYRTLSFSSRAFLPEGERADINLFVYRGEAKEYHSMAAPAALVDALVVALSQQMGAESAQRLGRLHAMKRAYAPDR